MTAPEVPVLWLCGPPGVGKTAVAWEVFSRLRAAGEPVAYVDIDQLGICYPEPADDPGRYRLKARNLAAVVDGYRAAGARRVVVSGVVDAERGVRPGDVPGADVMLVRLRVGAAELARRLVAREGADAHVASAAREAVALDAGAVSDLVVDTHGRSVGQVAARVLELADARTNAATSGGGAGGGAGGRADRGGGPGAVEVRATALWVCGATGVGTSTVGFAAYLATLRAGLAAAYVDLGQVGFLPKRGADDVARRARASNLGALWRNARAVGATRLVVVGHPADEREVAQGVEALGVPVSVCRLHAGPAELGRRLARRARGGGSWAEPGDPWVGLAAPELGPVVERAALEAAALDAAGLGDVCVATDGRSVEDVVADVLARTGWPGVTAGPGVVRPAGPTAP